MRRDRRLEVVIFCNALLNVAALCKCFTLIKSCLKAVLNC